MSRPDEYKWSSYTERVSSQMGFGLDYDVCYLGLANEPQARINIYKQLVELGVSSEEKQFIADSVNRDQLTGNSYFVDEIEKSIGLRVERQDRAVMQRRKINASPFFVPL
jgi:putative transposase